jgi:lipopolysaccharide heptosyltransferase II
MDDDAAWRRARRILCVRLDGVGDVLMTTPALRALRISGEGPRELTLLTSTSGADLLPLLPDLGDAIAFEAPWMKATASPDSARDRRMISAIRDRRFDAAVIFTVCSQNPLPAAVLCHLADVPLRLAHCRENPYGLLTRWIPDVEGERARRHEVRRQLDLVAAIGARPDSESMAVHIPERARDEAARELLGIGIARPAEDPWIAVHPGASAHSRRYPEEGFATVGDALAEAGHRIVFTGSFAERDLVGSIRSRMRRPSSSLAGRLTIEELAAVLSLAPLAIANNSGPAHLAAAVGTPIVDLYALTNLQHMPWMAPSRVLFHDVPCKGCLRSVCPLGHHDCLRLVQPSAVVDAANDLLLQTSERRSVDRQAGRSAPIVA